MPEGTVDEVDLFALLRPSELPLDSAARRALRASLFGGGDVTVDEQPDFEVHPEPARRARRPWLSVAAAVVLTGAVGGLVFAATNRDGAVLPAPAEQPDAAVPPDDALPRFVIGQPGWTMTHASERSYLPELVLLDPDEVFDGPRINVQSSNDGSISFGDDRSVAIGTLTGTVSGSEPALRLEWTDAAGAGWVADGWSVSEATLIDAAAAVVANAAGRPTLSAQLDGLVVADETTRAVLGRYGGFGFERDDGATVEISLYPGGEGAMYSRVSGEERSTVVVDGEEYSVLDYDSTPGDDGSDGYRVDILRGNWVWEFDGAPFGSVGEFVDLVRSVEIVDDATWQASLPDGVVGPDDGARVVEQLLAGVTLPPDFDPATVMADRATNDRYQMIAGVSGAVACAWLNDWFDADEAGDDIGKAAAAAGLATARDWPMLIEIESQGGWSGAVWEYADAVNGGPGIGSGLGPVPPDRANAESGLGCVFD